jgi:hypothetical protein
LFYERQREVLKMSAITERKGILASIRSFTGIDVVTIGVLAILFRVVGMPIYRVTSAAFPYNIGLRFAVDAFLCAIAVVVVAKRGTLFAYTLTWWVINLAVEGEDLVWLIGMWFPMIAGEWYLSTRKPYGGSLKDVIIGAGLLYSFFFGIVYWIYLVTFYELVYSIPAILGSNALILVGSIVGPYLGYLLGTRVKRLTV